MRRVWNVLTERKPLLNTVKSLNNLLISIQLPPLLNLQSGR